MKPKYVRKPNQNSKASPIVHCLRCNMVKGKGTQTVDIELQERTFGNNQVIYCPTKLEKEQVFECKLTLGSQYAEVCERILSFLNEHELQLMVVDCVTELWMVIHKRPLRFSLLEHGLITGLNYSSTYPAISEEAGFRRTHFPGTSTVTLPDLEARIDEFQGDWSLGSWRR
ncbi:hypothetical protein F511_04916 [Dorcoceras hygrometricum]|uniref:Uncharacterized protein n=1 Tax=Dorcoceras hygrometricum TaxID=472368 RepID=A0A2Z7BK01_9LAMI|nr:hypothetical protein F511_04916 [Dorcoceras hygrometricum]